MLGDAITTTQTIYIFNSDVNTCTNETSFEVIQLLIQVFQDTTVCGSYTIPDN